MLVKPLRQQHPSPNHRQCGVGLVEILVTIVVLAIGFLSTANMQIFSMRFSQSAYMESQAYFMVGEMVDRMRANVEGVKLGAYDNLTTSASAENPGCDNSPCTPARIALQDIYDWSQYLYSANDNFVPLLPSNDSTTASGTVTLIGSGKFSLAVSWADENISDDGEGTIRVDIITED